MKRILIGLATLAAASAIYLLFVAGIPLHRVYPMPDAMKVADARLWLTPTGRVLVRGRIPNAKSAIAAAIGQDDLDKDSCSKDVWLKSVDRLTDHKEGVEIKMTFDFNYWSCDKFLGNNKIFEASPSANIYVFASSEGASFTGGASMIGVDVPRFSDKLEGVIVRAMPKKFKSLSYAISVPAKIESIELSTSDGDTINLSTRIKPEYLEILKLWWSNLKPW